MLHVRQFCRLVIVPALEAIELESQAAIELLLGTAIKESGLHYLKQIGGGPALGLFQMEPATHDDIWTNYLAYRSGLVDKVEALGVANFPLALVGNLWYAAAMARIHYLRVPQALPAAGDIEGQAAYWKQHYNTPAGKGTAAQYLADWDYYLPEGLEL